jgi:hypothetical protein
MRYSKARGLKAWPECRWHAQASAWGQPFTFRPPNKRRLMTAEADQALTS